jgi:hypothetical protein
MARSTIASRLSFAAAALGLMAGVGLADDPGNKMFKKPKINGYMLDYCRTWGKGCGKPAADAFCLKKGLGASKLHAKWSNVGQPTQLIGTGQICDAPTCGSFSYIVCAPKKGINLDATSESDFGDVN